jgi:pre-mRNA-processing factor 8
MGHLILDPSSKWDFDTSVCLTTSFTTGSCSLSLYRLTQAGLDWAKSNKENGVTQVTSPNPPGYGQTMYERVQMILSDKFLGFYMVPEGGVWNYNFNGINFSNNMRYSLVLDNPKDFYNEAHRTAHFLDFGREQQSEEVGGK